MKDLKRTLELLGWTQKRLAQEVRVSKETVCRWVNGKQEPPYVLGLWLDGVKSRLVLDYIHSAFKRSTPPPC